MTYRANDRVYDFFGSANPILTWQSTKHVRHNTRGTVIRNRTDFPPIGSDRNSRVTPPLAGTRRQPHCEQHNASRDCAMVIVRLPFAYSVERYS